MHEVVGATPKDQPKRILVFDHALELGGAQIAMLHAIDAQKAVWEWGAVVPEEGPYSRELTSLGVSVRAIPALSGIRRRRRDSGISVKDVLHLPAIIHFVFSVCREIASFKPDLVYINSLKAFTYAAPCAFALRRTTIFHVRDFITQDWLPNPIIYHLVRWGIRHLADAVIANSQATASVLPRVATVIYSPIDARFYSSPPRPGLLDGSMRGQQGFNAVCVARLDPWKGQDLAIRAFAQSFAGQDGHILTLVGGPLFGQEEYMTHLYDVASSAGVGDQVLFTGQISDVLPILDSADVLISTTAMAEPFGQTILQAQARGIAVVAPEAGGPLELIENEVNGLLYAPGDQNALCESMIRLRDDPELRHALGVAAYSSARSAPFMRSGAQLADFVAAWTRRGEWSTAQ